MADTLSRFSAALPFQALFVLIAACSVGPSTHETSGTGSTVEGLSFAAGNNAGYCASNASANCTQGTPLGAKKLVLTFDDGPGSQTLELSGYLRAKGIRATFFVNGKNFGADAANVLSRLVADGHLVANHTQDHLNLTTLDDASIVRQVADTDAIIAPYVSRNRFLFRAPFGAWSARDYEVLRGTAMNKYVGPVRWDVGGGMTARYAADWDCWQNTSGYGVQTSKQCGDRYRQEIADIGRGIVLMHDGDYGDPSNHSLTSGRGNTFDMVKYLVDGDPARGVPGLLAQGYEFRNLDDVPDIAAAFGGGGGACAFDPRWEQTEFSNEWWVEFLIGADLRSARLEVMGGQTTPLSFQYGKWIGPASARIPRGTQVIVRAENANGQSAQTKPFAYLDTARPSTSCGAACDAAFAPTVAQGAGANNWWVEYAIGGDVRSARLEIVGGPSVTLTAQYGKWASGSNVRIEAGTNVIVHAEDGSGRRAQTRPFGYLTTTAPQLEACR